MSHPQKVPGPLLSTSTSSRKKRGWVGFMSSRKRKFKVVFCSIVFLLSNLNKLIGILSGWL